MAHLDLYIDTFADPAQSLVVGPFNRGQFPLPPFTQNDTVSLRVYLLARNTSFPLNPYTIINNSSLSLALAIGVRSGTGDGDHVVEQFTWSKDANNQYFYADVAFNTSELATAIGSASQLTTQYLEIEYRQGAGLPTTVFQRQITINADVIKNSTQALAPGQTAMSVEDANATFLKKDGTNDVADSKIWRSPDGTKRILQYVDNDGVMHFDLLT